MHGILVRKTIFGLNKAIGVNFRDLFKALGKAIADYNFGKWNLLAKDGVDALAALRLQQDAGHLAWLLIYRSLNRAIHQLVEDNQDLFRSKYKNYDSMEEKLDFSLEDAEIIIDSNFFKNPKQIFKQLDINKPYYEFRGREEKQYQKLVANLETHLENWLNQADKDDSIRIISGDPGSGKSSFSKMFAAKQAEKSEIPILFIPLHHFDATGDLVTAIGKLIRDDDYLSHNPLDGELKESRLLIIFDGLDELSMQGKLGAEVAKSFINEVQKTVSRINYRQTHLQVLISGRPIVIQSNRGELRKSEQILHILPYFIPESKRYKYEDPENLLTEDRRDLWWQKYSEVSDNHYAAMPEELNLNNLVEITTQPLLNYLIALSYIRSKNDEIEDEDKIIFSEETNLNAIYQDLLKSVYKRGWDTDQHPTLKGVEYRNFVRILEEIALAAWHGNGRTTTVKEIESHCESSGLKRLLEIFAERAKSGVTSLLTAFYFRQSGYGRDGDRTFEFTHKSFGEYLIARRIVRELTKINKELKNRDEDPDEGWDEKQALTRWIIICGISAIDEYLFKFICDEIALNKTETVKQWQKTLDYLISYMLCHGMPMEQIAPRPSYKEECQQSRNAEEALLVVLNACARYTEEISEIDWPSEYSFTRWLSRLQNQIEDDQKIIVNQYLSWLNLNRAILSEANLNRADLQGADLQGADLQGAILQRSNLQGADLQGAILSEANLNRAVLSEAILSKANLNRAVLQGAVLQRSNLQGAILSEANLNRADLQGAVLQRSNLQGANLNRAILSEANLNRADLQGADLNRADLNRADLQGAILSEANLNRAVLSEANLQRSNLQGANLQRSNLQRSNLQGAVLSEANLNRADLSEANLRETILRETNINRANLQGTILSEANLEEVNLNRADLQGIILDDDVR